MEKRKRKLLQRIIAVLFSVVLVIEMTAGAVTEAKDAETADAGYEVSYSIDGGEWKDANLFDVIWDNNAIKGQNVQIKLLRDITLTTGGTGGNWDSNQQMIGTKDGSKWTIDGCGHTITRGAGCRALFFTAGSSTVTMKNITIDGGAKWSGDDLATRTNSGIKLSGNGALIWVDNGGTLILESGVTLQNSDLGSGFYGAAVTVGGTGNCNGKGNLIIKEGVALKNNRANQGGAICVLNNISELTMEGGTIENNQAGLGGGVLSVGTVEMTGGKIANNYAENAGGVFFNKSFIMSGGEICGNESADNGGGVYCSGNFKMKNSKIANNQASTDTGSGGGVYISSSATLQMEDGIIENNKSASGGGVYNNGKFIMKSSSINGNEITGTTGGGLFVCNGSLNLSGNSVITENKDGKEAANNVYLNSGRTISISDELTEGAKIGVTTKSKPVLNVPVAVTGNNKANYSQYFHCDSGEYQIVNGSDNIIQLAYAVAKPVASPAAGTYTEDQQVTLSTTTEEAEIYYTMDGTEPSKEKGTKYTGAILVKGIEGKSVETVIKAIAIKDGMQDSGILEAVYTIATPVEVKQVIAAGNGSGNWLSGASWDPAANENKMTETSENVYEITYKNVPKGKNYQVRFAVNDSWNLSWGGTFTASSAVTPAITPKVCGVTAGSITFDIDTEAADVILKLDLTGYNGITKEGATFTITLNALHTHSYGSEWKSDSENHWHGCSCGVESEKASHSFGAWTVTKNGRGTKERRCSVCGYKETKVIPVITHTHSFGSEWKSDGINHWHGCSCGAESEKASHSFSEWTVMKQATESEEGLKERKCSVCGYKETESIPVIVHTHSYGSGWGSDSMSHWHECSCGEKSEKASHSFGEWTVTKQATESEEGAKERRCGVCGYKETEVIPKTGGNSSDFGKIETEKEQGENTPDTDFKTSKDDLISAVLLPQEQSLVEAGTDVKITLVTNNIDASVNQSDKQAVIDKADGYEVGQYLDINLYKIIGANKTKVSQTNEKIKIVFAVPDSLKNTDSGKIRNFAVVRVHSGVAELLEDTDNDEATITIETDQFSTYAILYKESSSSIPSAPTPTSKPKPTLMPTSTSEMPSREKQTKNELKLNAQFKVSQPGSNIKVSWGRVSGADGYDVYVQYCGKKFIKKSIIAVKGGKTTKVTVKKINGKTLNLKKNYKVYVFAYKLADGKKTALGKTMIAHIVGKKNTKYTNVKAVKVKKSSYYMKKGKTARIKARTVLVNPGKKQLSDAHAKEFRYATTNKKVAAVSKKGKIKAVGKGICTIYIYARNGYTKKIKVTVK